MRSAGLCIRCRQPKEGTTDRCRACTIKAVAANNKTRAEAKASSLCINCKTPWTGLSKNCPACLEATRQKWTLRAASDACIRCAGPRDGKRKACEACRAGMRALTMGRRGRYAEAGCCVQCGQPRDAGSEFYCRMHILKLAAYRWLDDASRWMDLDALLLAQGGRCAYTGEELILGKNASIDHKIPRSRGGTNTIENLQWVTWTVNRVKTDLTHDEFVTMCAAICDRHRVAGREAA